MKPEFYVEVNYLKKGDLVQVYNIDERKRDSYKKFDGKVLRVKSIGSSVWMYNIQLEPLFKPDGIEELSDILFLERHGWNASELRSVQ